MYHITREICDVRHDWLRTCNGKAEGTCCKEISCSGMFDGAASVAQRLPYCRHAALFGLRAFVWLPIAVRTRNNKVKPENTIGRIQPAVRRNLYRILHTESVLKRNLL